MTRDELKTRLFIAVAALATTGAAIYAIAAPFETPH